MSERYQPAVRILAIALSCIFLLSIARADDDVKAKRDAAMKQFTDDSRAISQKREAAARQLADKIVGVKLHKIYVPDFEGAPGNRDPLGCLFAASFSKLLGSQSNGFAVIDRLEVHRYLDRNGWTDGSLSNTPALEALASAFGPDAILWGSVSQQGETYSIDFDLRDIDGKELANLKYAEQISSSVAGYFPPTSDESGHRFYFSGFDGLTSPKCQHCPFPKYGDFKQKKIQGTVGLSVLVTAEGKAEEIRVLKSLDPELDGRALQAVRSWRFHPASDENGKRIPVRVPIEVAFILY